MIHSCTTLCHPNRHQIGLNYCIIGDPKYCIDSTINVAFPGVSSEALMLSTKAYCGVSNGSACTSKTYSPSYVLRAMKIPDEMINSAIRISWGRQTDKQSVSENINSLLRTAYEMVN